MTKTLDEYVTEAVPYENELVLIHRPLLSHARSVFEKRFGVRGAVYNMLKDFKYYTGGWPSEDSPPRFDAFAEKTGLIIAWLHAIGRGDELNRFYSNYGIRVEVTDPIDLATVADEKKFDKALHRYYGSRAEELLNMDPQELACHLIDIGCDAQRDICNIADAIKIDIGEAVEKDHKISVSKFRDLVRLKSTINLGKSGEKIVEKIENEEEQYNILLQAASTAIG